MSQYRCESCDIPLTVEQLRIEVGICPPCRAELDRGYAANRQALLLQFLFLLQASK